MLVLCSNGLSSEEIADAIRKYINGCKTAALVVTADNEYKENNYHVKRCVDELTSLNICVDVLDIDKVPAEKLLAYDVVEFIGGNPYYLLNSIRENKAEEILKKIADDKILIGWSAAAFVFGPTLELINRYSPELNFLGLNDLKGLALTETEVLPHYSKYLSRFDRFEEVCSDYENEKKLQVIRLNDGEGVFLRNGEAEGCFIGQSDCK